MIVIGKSSKTRTVVMTGTMKLIVILQKGCGHLGMKMWWAVLSVLHKFPFLIAGITDIR